MNAGKYIAGVGFCGIAAFLYATNYIVVAAFASRLTQWGTPPGQMGTAATIYSSDSLVSLSAVSLTVGVAFLVSAEVAAWRSRRDANNNEHNTA